MSVFRDSYRKSSLSGVFHFHGLLVKFSCGGVHSIFKPPSCSVVYNMNLSQLNYSISLVMGMWVISRLGLLIITDDANEEHVSRTQDFLSVWYVSRYRIYGS